MFNDHLSNEFAKERIAQRMKEVEGCTLQTRLGYVDTGKTRWAFALVLLVVIVAVSLLI